MQHKPNTVKLYNDIRKEHERLINVKEFGVQKHTDAWIRNWLADRFYKSVITIENIIFHRV